MKLAIAAILAGSAAAFAPSAQVSRTSVATNMAFESELGAQPPLGFFDPLGLLNDADQERFDRLRYVESGFGRDQLVLQYYWHCTTSINNCHSAQYFNIYWCWLKHFNMYWNHSAIIHLLQCGF